MPIKFADGECKKHFETLQQLNQHIAKTKHNDGIKITRVEVLQKMGFFSARQTVDLASSVSAI